MSKSSAKYETWYEVVHNTGAVRDESRGIGFQWPETTSVRFSARAEAERFAARATCNGLPATVREMRCNLDVCCRWVSPVVVGAGPWSDTSATTRMLAEVQS